LKFLDFLLCLLQLQRFERKRIACCCLIDPFKAFANAFSKINRFCIVSCSWCVFVELFLLCRGVHSQLIKETSVEDDLKKVRFAMEMLFGEKASESLHASMSSSSASSSTAEPIEDLLSSVFEQLPDLAEIGPQLKFDQVGFLFKFSGCCFKETCCFRILMFESNLWRRFTSLLAAKSWKS
jgi:hypothetical protein